MLNEEQIESFQRNGFLNGGCVLDDAAIAELSEDLERIVQQGKRGFTEGERQPISFRDINALRTGDGGQPVWQIVNIWEASDPFHRLIYHPSIVKAVSQLTGEPALSVWHDQIQYKPASYGGATTWHQDAPLWPSIRPMTPVSAWIPLGRRGRRERMHVDGAREPQVGQSDCFSATPGETHRLDRIRRNRNL